MNSQARVRPHPGRRDILRGDFVLELIQHCDVLCAAQTPPELCADSLSSHQKTSNPQAQGQFLNCAATSSHVPLRSPGQLITCALISRLQINLQVEARRPTVESETTLSARRAPRGGGEASFRFAHRVPTSDVEQLQRADAVTTKEIPRPMEQWESTDDDTYELREM